MVLFFFPREDFLAFWLKSASPEVGLAGWTSSSRKWVILTRRWDIASKGIVSVRGVSLPWKWVLSFFRKWIVSASWEWILPLSLKRIIPSKRTLRFISSEGVITSWRRPQEGIFILSLSTSKTHIWLNVRDLFLSCWWLSFVFNWLSFRRALFLHVFNQVWIILEWTLLALFFYLFALFCLLLWLLLALLFWTVTCSFLFILACSIFLVRTLFFLALLQIRGHTGFLWRWWAPTVRGTLLTVIIQYFFYKFSKPALSLCLRIFFLSSWHCFILLRRPLLAPYNYSANLRACWLLSHFGSRSYLRTAPF